MIRKIREVEIGKIISRIFRGRDVPTDKTAGSSYPFLKKDTKT